MTRKTLLTLFAVTLLAAPAWAQTFKDGPHVGFVTGGDSVDPDTAFGWQAAYEFNDTISLDLTITRMQDNIEGSDMAVPPFPDTGGIELETWALALTTRFGTLVGDKFYIYAGGGLGYYFFSEEAQRIRESLSASPLSGPSGGRITDVEIKIEDDLGYHGVVGFEILLAEAWEFIAEARFASFESDADTRVIETIPTDDFGKSRGTTTGNGTFDYDHVLFRLGVNYRF